MPTDLSLEAKTNNNNWIITSDDINSNQNTFTKTTSSGNSIVFSKTSTSVKNTTQITGMRDVTFTSLNDLILISTGFNNTEFIYGELKESLCNLNF